MIKFKNLKTWFTPIPNETIKFRVISKSKEELPDLEYSYCVYKINGKPHLTINFNDYQEGFLIWK